MSDTVYEAEFDGRRIVFTRFWRHGDWVQITTGTDYGILPLEEFRKAVKLLEENVESTKNAWWHELTKVKAKT